MDEAHPEVEPHLPVQRGHDRLHSTGRPSRAGFAEAGPALSVVPAPTENQAQAAPRRAHLDTLVLSLADLAGLAVALIPGDVPAALVVAGVSVAMWHLTGLYARRFTRSLVDQAPRLLLGALGGLGALGVITGGRLGPSLATVLAWLAGVFVARSAAFVAIRRLRRHGRQVFPAVVVGTNPAARVLARRILEHPETGLRLVAPPNATRDGASDGADLTLRDVHDLQRALAENSVGDVFLSADERSVVELVEELRVWGKHGTAVHTVPTLYQFQHVGSSRDQVWGVPLETVRRRGHRHGAQATKRTMDVVIAGAGLLLLSPLLALLALAVRREVGRGIIFRQPRVGRHGEVFELYKFRSLRQSPTDARWSVVDASLLGPVGRFIRRYSLDELPQLVNILRGDMSLVGPRPERPEYVDLFEDEIDGYRHRHRVDVGLTGLAAVRGLRGNSSLEDRVYFDNLYIENWSVWLDVKILTWTVASVLGGTGR